jgi:hypothetical protein
VRDFFTAFILFSQSVSAVEWLDEDCGRYGAYSGKLFSLHIATSFHGEAEFKLCKSESQNYLTIATTELAKVGSDKPPARLKTRNKIILFEQEYVQIVTLYEKALSYNTLDDVMGMDGSTWCLESQRGINYTEACFWMPSFDSEERGLSDLYNLADYLWEFTGLSKNEAFRLY